MWLNVGSGQHPAPHPWVNVDTHHYTDYGCPPDLIVAAGEPLPFHDGSCERILCSHVIEHVPWAEVPAFLHDLHRLLSPNGEILVVSPDVERALFEWKAGRIDGSLLRATMEHADDNEWPEQRHHWNCTQRRTEDALAEAGFVAVTGLQMGAWPLVGWDYRWQFATLARRAS